MIDLKKIKDIEWMDEPLDEEALRDYVINCFNTALKVGIPVKYALKVGSHARGTFHKGSDVDVILVTPEHPSTYRTGKDYWSSVYRYCIIKYWDSKKINRTVHMGLSNIFRIYDEDKSSEYDCIAYDIINRRKIKTTKELVTDYGMVVFK